MKIFHFRLYTCTGETGPASFPGLPTLLIHQVQVVSTGLSVMCYGLFYYFNVYIIAVRLVVPYIILIGPCPDRHQSVYILIIYSASW